jgi:trehalose/maltose transport system substrate-binding protein
MLKARLEAFCIAIALAQGVATLAVCAAQEEAIVVSCGAVGKEFDLCRQEVRAWAERTHHRARVISAPADSGERLALYQLLLAARSPDVDVFLVDTTWPGMIGDFFVDLKTQAPVDGFAKYFPAFIENNTVEGRLTAVPWFIDAGLLYYRKDLLSKYGEKPPATWQELTRVAEKVQRSERASGKDRFWGWVFQGRAYEGLTCNALEWVDSAGGGTFVDSRGKVTVDNPRARQALALAASWIGAISPPGVLNYMEEEARGVFQSGNALFMRNWPYAWNLAEAPDSPVRGKVGISALPSGGVGHAATLGGWSLAVSRFSHHIDEAASLVLWLAGPEVQKERALQSGLNPTIPALYRDPEVRASNPIAGELVGIFEHAIPRPSRVTGTRYNRVSAEIYDQVHDILEDRASPSQVGKQVAELDQALTRIGKQGRWGQ